MAAMSESQQRLPSASFSPQTAEVASAVNCSAGENFSIPGFVRECNGCTSFSFSRPLSCRTDSCLVSSRLARNQLSASKAACRSSRTLGGNLPGVTRECPGHTRVSVPSNLHPHPASRERCRSMHSHAMQGRRMRVMIAVYTERQTSIGYQLKIDVDTYSTPNENKVSRGHHCLSLSPWNLFNRFDIGVSRICPTNVGRIPTRFYDINKDLILKAYKPLFRWSFPLFISAALFTVFKGRRNWQRGPFRNWLDANVDRVYIHVNLPATCADPRMAWPACT